MTNRALILALLLLGACFLPPADECEIDGPAQTVDQESVTDAIRAHLSADDNGLTIRL